MSRKNITILTPTEMEADTLHGLRAEGADINLMVSGVGMAETGAAVARVIPNGGKTDLVILAGIAGASPASGLTHGDCVCAHTEVVGDLGAIRGGVFNPLYTKIYTSPLAAQTNLKTVSSVTVSCMGGPVTSQGFDIENMEGAAFFATCEAAGLPFLEIRAISNLTTDAREHWDIPNALLALRRGLNAVIDSLV